MYIRMYASMHTCTRAWTPHTHAHAHAHAHAHTHAHTRTHTHAHAHTHTRTHTHTHTHAHTHTHTHARTHTRARARATQTELLTFLMGRLAINARCSAKGVKVIDFSWFVWRMVMSELRGMALPTTMEDPVTCGVSGREKR